MKVCIWSSSFQADTLALALALDQDPSVELLVVTKNRAAIVSEPIFRVRPVQSTILDRDLDDYESVVRKFQADIVFADNHLPDFPVPNKFLYHWHGLPLKIRPAKDLRAFHRHVERLIGSVKKENPKFLAQCYGDIDFNHRINTWELPEKSCRKWGSAYSDLLVAPPYEKKDLEDYFQLDLQGKKTILLSVTWHFGDRVFPVLGDDDDIFASIVNTANDLDANVIFSLHDRYRYTAALVEKIERHAGRCQNAFIKYKSDHADNLADLIASDVMICSFSSFIIFHYFTGKPSIHILPVDRNKTLINMPTIKKKRIRPLWRLNSDNLWMYPFSDNGGLVPENSNALLNDLKRALSDSSYGRNNAERFISNRFHLADGNTCQRIISDLKDWIQ